ncbi:hypothetical protein M2277_005062 [Paenibacillus sp. LBL]|uniref:hypothetical protein n=1 Tax=Paenibacillus sp. LBL TaxID=2940563 RepID=UPI002475F741|nr:hypothetical protein [Paenibacillus sp. LBL]MDH6674370.1 hypothetical protein [Paenibacillus sp. LBL]
MKRNRELHYTIEVEGKKYVISLLEEQQKNLYMNAAVYSCTVFNETDTITSDRFKLMYNRLDSLFWAWTGDIVTRVDKRCFREYIASLFNSKELKLTA